MPDVEVLSAQGSMPAYAAEPAGDGPAAGVLVVHEIFGLTPQIRSHADRLAAAGYLALAPDLYAWGAKPRCVASTMLSVRRRHGRVYDDMEAGRAWLADHPRSTGHVGIVGFCMGGSLALVHAPGGGYDAAAPNYAEVPRRAEELLSGICPVVASFGGRDRYLRGHAERLEHALVRLGVPHDVEEYPGATHSFMNEQPGPMAALTNLLIRVEYDPEAAEDAWRRIFSFFGEHLQGAAAG